MANLEFSESKVGARLPKSLKAADKKLLLEVARRSISDLNAGEQVRPAQGARIWAKALQDEGGDSPLLTCGEKCRHLLDEGNAPGYAVCYWACVIRGGDSVVGNAVMTKALKLKAKNFIKK
jgi:hypothetical protein